MDIKIRLLQLGLKQSDLLEPLEKRGFTVDASAISRALSGKCTQQRFQNIIVAVNEILTEIEKQK